MRKNLILFLAVAITLFPSVSHAEINEREILSFISNHIKKKQQIGIMVRSAGTGKTLFRYNSQKMFIPASNNKILSSSAALALLGKDFRFRTEFYLGGGIHSGVGYGSFYVKAYGDPTVDLEAMGKIAREIKALGITEINGGISIDASYFDDNYYGPGWEDDWIGKSYCPPITAVSFNYNVVKLRVSASAVQGLPARITTDPAPFPFRINNMVSTSTKKSGVSAKFDDERHIRLSGFVHPNRKAETLEISVPDPLFYFGVIMKNVFAENGIKIKGDIKRERVPKWAGIIFTHYSEPLETILEEYNKESINIIGDSIVKILGAEFMGTPGTWENGSYVMKNHLRRIGISEDTSVVDGSGLSNLNRVSAEDLTLVLENIYRNRDISSEFISSLPVAGVDGTLKKRFLKLRNKISAKTGYLDGVRSLSGYAYGRGGKVYIFSIIANGGSASTTKKLQELILRELVY